MQNHTTRGLRLLETQAPWYCGRVPSGRERCFERGLHRFGIHTYFPVHQRELTRHKYNYRTKNDDLVGYNREMPLFPGYVFVSLADGDWTMVRDRQAYRPTWLRVNGQMAEIPFSILEELQSREQLGFVQLLKEQEYEEGDELEVTDGIYRGWRGLLASDPDRRILTLHMITESYALEPALLVKTVKIERQYTRLAIH